MWKARSISKCTVYSSKQTLGADASLASATGFIGRGARRLATDQTRSDPNVPASRLSEMVDQLVPLAYGHNGVHRPWYAGTTEAECPGRRPQTACNAFGVRA